MNKRSCEWYQSLDRTKNADPKILAGVSEVLVATLVVATLSNHLIFSIQAALASIPPSLPVPEPNRDASLGFLIPKRNHNRWR
jgi:hypothetical protein